MGGIEQIGAANSDLVERKMRFVSERRTATDRMCTDAQCKRSLCKGGPWTHSNRHIAHPYTEYQADGSTISSTGMFGHDPN